jgi:hypothetical protein
MYSLSYLGRRVDKTLARYAHDKAFQQPPYTTTKEFLDYLREDTGPERALMPTCSKMSIFDDRTTRTAKKRDDGKYDVTLSLHAGKTYVDGVGRNQATFDVPVDIGVFAKTDGRSRTKKCCSSKSAWSPTATAA